MGDMMKKSLYNYIKKIDEEIEKNDVDLITIKEHLIYIQFYQHERLIHLLVTLTYALIFVLGSIISLFNLLSLVIVIISVLFLIPYIRHYFALENGVQYLYKQYDLMKEKYEKNNNNDFTNNTSV